MVEYCSLIEPKKEFINRAHYHLCLLKKMMDASPDYRCIGSDVPSFLVGTGNTRYREDKAMNCPLFSTKERNLGKLVGLLRE